MTIELTQTEQEQISTMLDTMEEKGTLRSRNAKSVEEQRRMWMAGVGAQMALKRFFDEEYNVSTEVNTRAYDDVSADNGDLWKYQTPTGSTELCEPCEVKKTADYANHVAITEAEARLVGDDEPIVYARTSWDGGMPAEPSYEIVGWCFKSDLNWVEKGEKPWTRRNRNLCQPLKEMRTDWREFLSIVCPEAEPSSKFTFTPQR